MSQIHTYQAKITWTGNTGTGTSGYKDYERSHTISIPGKPDIPGSSDPSFRGNPEVHNPEDLLLSSLSGCHMLWFLHLCSVNGVVITAYEDEAEGVMELDKTGAGKFTEVTLRPKVTILECNKSKDDINQLHYEANKMCFIANSVNFPVIHDPILVIQ